MFEIGEKYEITTGLGEEEGHSVYTVTEWQFPLLKVLDGVGHEYIFNTTSPSFVGANKSRPRKPSVYPPRLEGDLPIVHDGGDGGNY